MFASIIARKKIRTAFEALSLQDLDAFLTYWADDAVFSCPGPNGPGFPDGVPGMEGKEAIRQWFEVFVGQWEYATFMVKHVCVKNLCPFPFGKNVITVEWDLMLKSKEKAIDTNTSGVAVIDVDKGKASEVRIYECMGNPILPSMGSPAAA